MLPQKRKPIRSGILRAPKRVWNRHRAFIRRHTCVVTLSRVFDECDGRIEVSHIRTAANAGTALKPIDASSVPMCTKHHLEYHRGDKTFEAKYGLDLAKLAEEFTALSTDTAMKEAMREWLPEQRF